MRPKRKTRSKPAKRHPARRRKTTSKQPKSPLTADADEKEGEKQATKDTIDGRCGRRGRRDATSQTSPRTADAPRNCEPRGGLTTQIIKLVTEQMSGGGEYVLEFQAIDRTQVALVGGKGAQ